MTKLGLLFIGSVLAGCTANSGSTVPSNVNVEVLQTSKIVLRGTADASLERASCQGTVPTSPKHMLELKEEMLGKVTLRAAAEGRLASAVLHVVHVESSRSWCATMGESYASIPSSFPAGTYAISVADLKTNGAQKYEVVVEKL
jgi:hypothetical protein